MKISTTEIEGVLIVEPKVFGDSRGFFMETYKKSVFEGFGLGKEFVQDNHSRSQKGVLRGLHYQLNPHPIAKLVRVVGGEVFDVGVDIRRGSKTFGKWFGGVLSSENKKMFYFPSGFAHGFYALTDGAEVLYKCTGEYHPGSERGLIWNDPKVAISWPIQDGIVHLNEKDKLHPGIDKIETNF